MQPYYIHTAKTDTTKHPSERHAHKKHTKQVKYLGLHLDTQLAWKQYTKLIIDKIQTTRRQIHFLTSRKSKLSIENKLKIYKTIIKPIWTYGIPLWGTEAMSHINKIETIQAKILRTIVNAPWYVRNENGGTWEYQRSKK